MKFVSNYFPHPYTKCRQDRLILVDTPHVKIYNTSKKIKSIRNEMVNNKNAGITHIINMPGNLKTICNDARNMDIGVLDVRMCAYISENT